MRVSSRAPVCLLLQQGRPSSSAAPEVRTGILRRMDAAACPGKGACGTNASRHQIPPPTLGGRENDGLALGMTAARANLYGRTTQPCTQGEGESPAPAPRKPNAFRRSGHLCNKFTTILRKRLAKIWGFDRVGIVHVLCIFLIISHFVLWLRDVEL